MSLLLLDYSLFVIVHIVFKFVLFQDRKRSNNNALYKTYGINITGSLGRPELNIAPWTSASGLYLARSFLGNPLNNFSIVFFSYEALLQYSIVVPNGIVWVFLIGFYVKIVL